MTSIKNYEPLPEGNRQYPVPFIEENRIIKLSEEADRYIVGWADTLQSDMRVSVEKLSDKRIEWVELDSGELTLYLSRRYSVDESAVRRSVSKEDSLDKLANDAPIVNLVNSLMIEGIRSGASDIHLEIFEGDGIARFRVDGRLKEGRVFPAAQFPAVSSRIKILANLNIMERRLPQDGRLTVRLSGEKVDMRVSIVPISRGESIVLRILGQKKQSIRLGNLGFPGEAERKLRRIARNPHGLFLVTGPTGCGKTTTLNALLEEIKKPELKIITIEDPVEYRIDGVDQIQTDEKIGLGFGTLLRNVLRQDPDIIMVGEIRDRETAQLALRASLTGHLVLSTLHTNDSISVIPRLRNMGLESYLVAGVLRGASAQRLVRRICPECRRKKAVTPREAGVLDALGSKESFIYHPVGCEHCGGSGYKGRIAIIESWIPDEELESAIASETPLAEIRKMLLKKDFQSLTQDGLERLRRGETSLDELERVLLL